MELYGLIGHPLGHSFSARLFNDAFRSEGVDAYYDLFDLDNIAELPQLLDKYPELKGLNVTIPYKESVIPYLDRVSDAAREIGAVNCIEIGIDLESGRRILTGHNTDSAGFADSISPLLRPDITSALVLGTGGASKAVCHALKGLGIRPITVSRYPGKGNLTYSHLTRHIIEAHRLIINSTPLGMWPYTTSAPELPYSYITSAHICYDLVYNPEVTRFMSHCATQGAEVCNGLAMLRAQAANAARIWRLPDSIANHIVNCH